MAELHSDLSRTQSPSPHGIQPLRRVNAGFIGTLALSLLGMWMAVFAPIQILLAQQMEILAPGRKETTFGIVVSIGSVVALIANPVIGALSDRTTSRFGRRHPWNLGGLLLTAGALFMLGRQGSVTGVILWWIAVQLGTSAMLSAMTAVVPDRVPVSQRAMVSAWSGITISVGIVMGTLLTTVAVSGIEHGYRAISICLLVLSLPFLLVTRDTPLLPASLPTWSWHAFLTGFWINPRKHPDFAWAWVTRFLVTLGNAMATVFFLYFLRDGIHYEQLFPGRRAEDGLMTLVLLYTVAVIVSAFVCATVSDRTGRRKLLVAASGTVMSLATLMLAVWPGWPLAMVSAVVLGLGYGAYMAVDQALITQVLPTSGDHSRDLGVINIAIVGPQVLAPIICAIAVTRLGGYSTLYLIAGGVGLIGGLLVHRIRNVP